MDTILWFDAKKSPPTKTGNVLVFSNDINSSWMEVVNAYICPEYENLMWESLDSGEDYAPIVTHWAELPSKPNHKE